MGSHVTDIMAVGEGRSKLLDAELDRVDLSVAYLLMNLSTYGLFKKEGKASDNGEDLTYLSVIKGVKTEVVVLISNQMADGMIRVVRRVYG